MSGEGGDTLARQDVVKDTGLRLPLSAEAASDLADGLSYLPTGTPDEQEPQPEPNVAGAFSPLVGETWDALKAAGFGQDALDTKAAADDLRMWSVTTIIGVLDKPALLYWAAEQTAKAAVAARNSLDVRVSEDGEAEVIRWLRDARFRRVKGARTATELGTEVHAAAEEYALTGVRPEVDAEIAPFLDSFDRWCQRAQPEYQATEVTVYSPTYGYAGTCDAFLTVDGVRMIADYKSTAKDVDGQGKPTSPYPDQVALQLAAYRWAECAAVWRPRRQEIFRRRYYLLGPAEQDLAVPVPEVDGGVCIHITPTRCEAYPIECGRGVHEAFLYILEAARWVNETSKMVMSDPLEFGPR